MFSFLGFLTGLINPITQIANKIADLRIAREQAKSNIEKAKIDAQVEQLNAQKALLIAEAQHERSAFWNTLTRGLLTIPVILFLFKMLAWDKVVGPFAGCTLKPVPYHCYMFRTDAIDPNMWWVVIAALGFYFLTSRKP